MNITKTAFSVAAALVLGSAAEVALSDNTDATADRIKAAVTPGEMVLSGSDVKSIHTGSTVAKYRVCMKKEQGDAEMKVSYDDQDTLLKSGHCKTVTGKAISATASKPLSGSDRIVATYHRVKSDAGSDSGD
jgi:hypothetical protein